MQPALLPQEQRQGESPPASFVLPLAPGEVQAVNQEKRWAGSAAEDARCALATGPAPLEDCTKRSSKLRCQAGAMFSGRAEACLAGHLSGQGARGGRQLLSAPPHSAPAEPQMSQPLAGVMHSAASRLSTLADSAAALWRK